MSTSAVSRVRNRCWPAAVTALAIVLAGCGSADPNVGAGTAAAPFQPVAQEDSSEGEPAQAGPLNDTPIFRAMMSNWLTDPSAQPAAENWSPTEADAAWSAAARIEEQEPVQESSAGLPMRRPGSNLIPGAMDAAPAAEVAPASPTTAPTGSRRDPETIRRNLNRHKNGVSAARTEAQDGTHREEADVHH